MSVGLDNLLLGKFSAGHDLIWGHIRISKGDTGIHHDRDRGDLGVDHRDAGVHQGADLGIDVVLLVRVNNDIELVDLVVAEYHDIEIVLLTAQNFGDCAQELIGLLLA